MAPMHNLTHAGSVGGGAITVAEAAAMLGTDRTTVIRWIKAGRLVPLAKLPGRTGSWLLDRNAVEAWSNEAAA